MSKWIAIPANYRAAGQILNPRGGALWWNKARGLFQFQHPSLGPVVSDRFSHGYMLRVGNEYTSTVLYEHPNFIYNGHPVYAGGTSSIFYSLAGKWVYMPDTGDANSPVREPYAYLELKAYETDPDHWAGDGWYEYSGDLPDNDGGYSGSWTECGSLIRFDPNGERIIHSSVGFKCVNPVWTLSRDEDKNNDELTADVGNPFGFYERDGYDDIVVGVPTWRATVDGGERLFHRSERVDETGNWRYGTIRYDGESEAAELTGREWMDEALPNVRGSEPQFHRSTSFYRYDPDTGRSLGLVYRTSYAGLSAGGGRSHLYVAEACVWRD